MEERTTDWHRLEKEEDEAYGYAKEPSPGPSGHPLAEGEGFWIVTETNADRLSKDAGEGRMGEVSQPADAMKS